jgi:catechol 1,2-dioxygenase
MSAHIFNTQEVQDFLRLASGLNQEGGNPRAKQIIHRILSDLYKAIWTSRPTNTGPASPT